MHRITRASVRLFLCATIWLTAAVCQQRLWSGQQQKPPDNTGTNKLDRNRAEPTADQQEMNASDREITRKIRRAIVEDKSLSTYAHNIKIITQDGRVTLKGAVRSEEEKATVEAKAAEIVGADRVRSEVSVVPKKTKNGN